MAINAVLFRKINCACLICLACSSWNFIFLITLAVGKKKSVLNLQCNVRFYFFFYDLYLALFVI